MTFDDDPEIDPEAAAGAEDDPLWRELREVVARADPVPPEVLRAARDSYTWRTVDAELAALAYDSAVAPAAGAVRGSEGPRELTFEASGLTVEVEVTALGTRRRLVGQLLPPQRARVEVRHRDGTVLVEADEYGRFRADDVPAGPSSLRCHLAGEGGALVATEWMAL